MRKFLPLLGLLFCALSVQAQTPTISPLNPVLQPGGTQTFTVLTNPGTGGTWSCANTSNGGACLGSINSGTGVYTAPATYAACTSLGGYQLLPCDHIFNTRIDSLAVDSGGATLNIASIARVSGQATITLSGACSPHCFVQAINTPFTVAGVTDSSFNCPALSCTSTGYDGNDMHLGYANAGADTSSSGGTVFIPYASGMGSAAVNFLGSFPYNYVDGTTPTDTLSFYYTPSANGTFQSPQWPQANIQTSWFGALADENADHHLITIDTRNGNIGERYQYFAQAPAGPCTVGNTGGTSGTCSITSTNTSSGFQRMAAVGGKQIEFGSFTGADTYMNGSFVLTAATTNSVTFNITHGAATTSTSGQVTAAAGGGKACAIAGTCNSASGFQYVYSDYTLPVNGTTAASNAIAPPVLKIEDMVQACENGGSINHMLSITVPNSYIKNAFRWPALVGATGSTSGINPYGIRYRLKAAFAIGGFSACAQKVLTGLKTQGVMLTDGGLGWQLNVEYGPMPPNEVQALKDINGANIAVTNWEPVDESGLMETASSGASSNGEVVTYTASTGSASTNVAIMGTAVNVAAAQYYIMAGTPAQQLLAYSAAGGITWSMSPTVGSITSGGLYTAPASVGTITTTTVKATSAVNGSVSSQMIVYVLPAANFNLIQNTANFTDSHSVVWYGGYGLGLTNAPSWQGCCQNDPSFANITDKQLFWNHFSSAFTVQDEKMDFHVPNGTYTLTFNNGTTWAAGTGVRNFYGQGVLLGTIDTTAVEGGPHLPYTLTQSLVVTNNILSFYNVGIGLQASNSGDVSSISISQTSSSTGVGSVVSPGVVIGPNVVVQ